MSSSNPEPGDDTPDHGGLVPDEIHDLIRRAHWQSAKSTEDVAPHQYVVIGWNKDDLTDEEFWYFVQTIKDLGRLEEWTPPGVGPTLGAGVRCGPATCTWSSSPTGSPAHACRC